MRRKRKRSCAASGQVISEYVIMLVFLAIIAIALVSLSYYFSLYGGRMVDMVSIEYP